MKVKELIEKLKEFEQELEVLNNGYDSDEEIIFKPNTDGLFVLNKKLKNGEIESKLFFINHMKVEKWLMQIK